MAGPLDGVKIIEMTSVVLGPWACQILADMGADVVKIEPPYGDSNRSLGSSHTEGMAALYLTCNRNKRSLVLNLKKEGAREALLALVKDADVLIHNYRPQVMKKMKLEYADLKQVNPDIIYCGTYGYAKDGPYGAKGALDDSIQAVSGVAMLNKLVLGEPRYLPTIVADKTTALTVVYAVLGALFHRERHGEGQEIEVPMYETMVHYVMAEHLWGYTFDPPLDDPGYTRLMSHHRKPYATKDGYIAILPYLDAHWETFCKLTEREDLLEEPKFKTLADRVGNIDDTYQITGEIMATRTTQEWLDIFGETSVPTIIVNSLEDLVSDPHLVETGFWQSMDHPTEGKLRMASLPAKYSATPADVRRHPPQLGEHSLEVLTEAGLDQEFIDQLLADGVTKQSGAA